LEGRLHFTLAAVCSLDENAGPPVEQVQEDLARAKRFVIEDISTLKAGGKVAPSSIDNPRLV
jgi:hypothetical protein